MESPVTPPAFQPCDITKRPLPDCDCASAFSSLESLADMTVCPVHCGRLDQPKVMPCGHVFCVTCLDKWAERQGGRQIECPMCRRCCPRPDTGAAGLPTARAHQAILDYLITHAARRILAHNMDPRKPRPPHQQSDPPPPHQQSDPPPLQSRTNRRKRPSLEMRQDLLAHLTDDLVRRADTAAPEAFDREELSCVMNNLSRVLQRLDAAGGANRASGGVGGGEAVEASDGDDDDNEDDDEEAGETGGGLNRAGVMSTEATAAAAAAAVADTFSTTQREMHRLSRYQMAELPLSWNREVDVEEGGIAGAGLLGRWAGGDHQRSGRGAAVLLGGTSRCLLLQPRSRRQRLIRLIVDQHQLAAPSDSSDSVSSSSRLRVVSMRVARGVIYLTGHVGRRSILAIVSPDDEAPRVLRCHTREEASESAAAQGFAGFHVEPSGPATVVAAQPGRQRVEFFDANLQPTGHWLVFDRLTPRHVAWASQLATLWVSCPDERLVLAVNDRTGVFRKLSTGDILQSAPSQIVAARMPDGHTRVVLADPDQGRLFWIHKRRKYIFLQRLQLPCDLPDITSLSALDGGCLLVTSRDRLYRLKPVCPRVSGSRSKCQLL